MAGRVRIENRQRDQKTIHIDATTKLVLGSTDDALVVDPTVPKPEVTVDLDLWKKAEKRKAVQGWIESGAIRVLAA